MPQLGRKGVRRDTVRARATIPRRTSMTPAAVRFRPVLPCVLALYGVGARADAQPSGGPYGPVPQTYSAPAGAPHVYYVAPDGKGGASGTVGEPTTLESAVERAVT